MGLRGATDHLGLYVYVYSYECLSHLISPYVYVHSYECLSHLIRLGDKEKAETDEHLLERSLLEVAEGGGKR